MTGFAIAAVQITVDGRSPGPDTGGLLAVRVVNRLGQPTQCELSLAAGADRGGWVLGAAVEVRVHGEADPLFVGDVTSVELLRPASPVGCRVRAYDRLQRLRGRMTPRVFTHVTAADLAATVTADLDLTVAAERTGPSVDRVVQHGQNDLELLGQVAAAAGLYPVLRGRTLHLVSLAGWGDPVDLRWGGSLWEVAVESNQDGVASSLTAIGWHPQRAQALTGTAEADVAGTKVEAVLVDQPARSQDGVTALAQAELAVRAARAVVLRGTATGSARLGAGTRIGVGGLGAGLDATYVVTAATHTVDGAGYQTVVSTEPPAPTHTPAGTSVTLGRVTAVDDPDRLGRVRISLPGLGDLDVGWLGVLCPGAGAGRGLVVLPDVGDLVVVALPHSSPVDGVVLGAVYGTTEPPDAGTTGGSVRRWSLRTADGQSIVVDDGAHSVRVENHSGSYVELAPDVVRLHATSALVIDAPGHGLTIRAASVDFEHAPL